MRDDYSAHGSPVYVLENMVVCIRVTREECAGHGIDAELVGDVVCRAFHLVEGAEVCLCGRISRYGRCRCVLRCCGRCGLCLLFPLLPIAVLSFLVPFAVVVTIVVVISHFQFEWAEGQLCLGFSDGVGGN